MGFELKEKTSALGRVQKHVPVPPVVGALGILFIINLIVSHQQVFPPDLVFVVVCHVGADSKAEVKKKRGRMN